jgi:hypothetical protein
MILVRQQQRRNGGLLVLKYPLAHSERLTPQNAPATFCYSTSVLGSFFTVFHRWTSSPEFASSFGPNLQDWRAVAGAWSPAACRHTLVSSLRMSALTRMHVAVISNSVPQRGLEDRWRLMLVLFFSWGFGVSLLVYSVRRDLVWAVVECPPPYAYAGESMARARAMASAA